jgi:hypothetical protein
MPASFPANMLKIGRRDRRLAIIELGASNLGVGVDEGLLVDTSDPL